jgi:hypothetical protein
MRRIPLTLAFLALAVLLPTLAVGRPAQPVEGRTAATQRCVYLPLISSGDQATAPISSGQSGDDPCQQLLADATATATNTPGPTNTGTATPSATSTSTTTATAQPGYSLNGAVGFYPTSVRTSENRTTPLQLMIVLDVSGSVSANAAGQCNNTGTVIQCEPGPPGSGTIDGAGTGSDRWWAPASERRIAVFKNSISYLIEQLNMPGNPGYNPALPSDEVSLVWFHHAQTRGMTTTWSSDPVLLRNAVLQAGSYQGDNYRTLGGTNVAAGLYRAALLLQQRQSSVVFNNQNYAYRRAVLLASDGTAKDFFNPNAANLSGGNSNSSTYPVGSECRALGLEVIHSIPCQTTEGGGLYQGFDRPITQMIKVANDYIKNDPQTNADLFVLSPFHDPRIGLKEQVASSAEHFFTITTFAQYANGSSNVDPLVRALKGNTATSCEAVEEPLQWSIEQANAGAIPPGAWE